MTMELPELLNALHNYFEVEETSGDFTISGGSFVNLPSSIQSNQYYKIEGSVFNDGIHKNPDTSLTDEVFSGTVYGMAVPKDVTDLLTRINTWETENASQAPTGITSEAFGGYSYTKATGADGMPATWREVFSRELRRWKKL